MHALPSGWLLWHAQVTAAGLGRLMCAARRVLFVSMLPEASESVARLNCVEHHRTVSSLSPRLPFGSTAILPVGLSLLLYSRLEPARLCPRLSSAVSHSRLASELTASAVPTPSAAQCKQHHLHQLLSLALSLGQSTKRWHSSAVLPRRRHGLVAPLIHEPFSAIAPGPIVSLFARRSPEVWPALAPKLALSAPISFDFSGLKLDESPSCRFFSSFRYFLAIFSSSSSSLFIFFHPAAPHVHKPAALQPNPNPYRRLSSSQPLQNPDVLQHRLLNVPQHRPTSASQPQYTLVHVAPSAYCPLCTLFCPVGFSAFSRPPCKPPAWLFQGLGSSASSRGFGLLGYIGILSILCSSDSCARSAALFESTAVCPFDLRSYL